MFKLLFPEQKMDAIRPGNNNLAGDELMRRLLASQRTIIEQNNKILEAQERQKDLEKDSTKTQVPLFVKVCAKILLGFLNRVV